MKKFFVGIINIFFTRLTLEVNFISSNSILDLKIFLFVYFFEKKLKTHHFYSKLRLNEFKSKKKFSNKNIIKILQENFYKFLPTYYLENIEELLYLEKNFRYQLNIKLRLSLPVVFGEIIYLNFGL